MNGCPYGLSSVVVTFNRYPILLTAMFRRIFCLLHGAYFDDNLLLDLVCTSDRSHKLSREWYTQMGTPPKESKGFPMASHRVFLGAAVTVDALRSDGYIVVSPKEATRHQVLSDIEVAVRSEAMSPAEAAKTRGRSGWVGANSLGRIGRLGLAVLKDLQYQPRKRLTSSQIRALMFHATVIHNLPPKLVPIVDKPLGPLVMYSDAEYTPGYQPRLGWVLFRDPPLAPLGFTWVAPKAFTSQWKVRKNQIFPAESAALPVGSWCLKNELRGRDLIWFVDNEAAAAAAIRGSTSEPDVAVLVEVAHLLWLSAQCRVWIEWIDSKSNPADGLSRAGLSDAWTAMQDWSLSEAADPPWPSPPCTAVQICNSLLGTLDTEDELANWSDIG